MCCFIKNLRNGLHLLVRFIIVSYKNRVILACDWHLKLEKLTPLRNMQLELTTTKLYAKSFYYLHYSLIAQHVNLGWQRVEIPKTLKGYGTKLQLHINEL